MSTLQNSNITIFHFQAKGETFEWPDIQAKDDGKKESNLEEQMARERKTRKIEDFVAS